MYEYIYIYMYICIYMCVYINMYIYVAYLCARPDPQRGGVLRDSGVADVEGHDVFGVGAQALPRAERELDTRYPSICRDPHPRPRVPPLGFRV